MTSKIKFDYSFLNGRIAEKGETRRSLGRKIGMTEESVGQKLNNGHSFKSKDVFAIAQVLDIPEHELGRYFFTQKV